MNARNPRSLIVPEAWSALDVGSLSGVLLIVGATDTGKSTFARWLVDQLTQSGRSTALLDGDVGQTNLGPPTTLTLDLPAPSSGLVHWFVGDVSPRGHMLPLVVGAGRLAQRALEAAAEVIVVDTTGLVDPAQGGVALKHALVDQLRPATLFAFQRSDELEPMLRPLRPLSAVRVVELPVSDGVRRRDMETRQAHRADAFRRYFADAETVHLSMGGRGLFDGSTFAPGRLVALQDVDGFALALGVVEGHHESRGQLRLRTPLTETGAVASVRLGAIGVEIDTGQDFRPGRRS